MSVRYDSVCRLCMSSRDELHPIFSTTSPDFASKIKDCVSIEIIETDGLPHNVCKKCLNNVKNWHIFKEVCLRTQEKFASLCNSSQLEDVDVKNEPLSDGAYEDAGIINGSYPENETDAAASSKAPSEGPPILASLGLTPRSDKGVESEKEDNELENEEEIDNHKEINQQPEVFSTPEVSITVMRPSGETLQAHQGIQQVASKNCLVCDRAYRYSHNARRHELTSHSFDRYTNKIIKKPKSHLQPKLRPNPFNPKARLIPNSMGHKLRLLPTQSMSSTLISPFDKQMDHQPSNNITAKSSKQTQNNLPYPLRIKALKDLQIKKKEPQILKTLLTSKPEMLISEPEIMNSGPESPETLISEPEIASFQVETILSEPDNYENREVNGISKSKNYDTVDMESDNEIEIARGESVNDQEDDQEKPDEDNELSKDNDVAEQKEDHVTNEEEEKTDNSENINVLNESEKDKLENTTQECPENEDYEEAPSIAPLVEINEDLQKNSTNANEEEDDIDESTFTNDMAEGEDEVEQEFDPNKTYVTKTQLEFINKYRDIIEQINTKRCLCCDKQYPRRKAVIQHLQKNGKKVPKHTCYNCVVTFAQLGPLLSHMRANNCTNLWKVIYNEEGITEDMVVEDEPKFNKAQFKDILNARSYACKLCPAKFQLKQFIMKHVLDVHEDGQSMVSLACVHCGSRFKDKTMWKKHIRNGECTVYISCDLCSEKFQNIQYFSEHALTEHVGNEQSDSQQKCVDGRPTDCPVCGKKMNNYPLLVKHLKNAHNDDKPHYCQHCDERYEQAADLNQHIYAEHSDRSLTSNQTMEPDMSIVKEEAEEYHYSCTECNAIFETVDAWTDHQVAEHNQIAHHCDQCEKKFLRPSELAEHKNIHLRIKFYPCNVCSNSYSTPQKLSDHVQQSHPGASSSFSGDTEFFCDICIRGFKSRQAYSNHMRIHAKVPTTNRKPGEAKSSSQISTKSFKQHPLLEPAINFKPTCNVPNAPYSCDICGKGFMHKKNIWKHKKVLHADMVSDKNDSEENTMHASTEEECNADDNAILSTPQFNSFNFSMTNNALPQNSSAHVEPQTFSCELCSKQFPIKSSLWKHKRIKHGIINPSYSGNQERQMRMPAGEGTSRSSCTICKISFSDKKSYYRHRKNVHRSATQMCKICGKPLSSTLELYEHLKSAHARELLGYNDNQGANSQELNNDLDYEDGNTLNDPVSEYQARFPCNTCGKQFVGLLALQNHQCVNQIQSQSQTFECEICHKSYTSIAALKSHRGWHLRSPDGKAAANNTGLWMPQHKVTTKVSKYEVVETRSNHASTAAAAKRRLPPEVEVTVVNPNKKMRSEELDADQTSNYSGPVDDRYCSICDKEFTKRAAYQRHMEEVHQPNSVFCPICDRSFTRKSTLLVHMKKHYEIGESSTSAHAESESSACNLCGAQFNNQLALKAHRARHHGEESAESEEESPAQTVGEFTCAQCGDGVATPRDLIAHRSMHSTPSNYFCNMCKVYFSRAVDLSSHTRARHAEADKPYFPCAMCDRFYMNKKSLQRHIEMAH